MFVFVLIVIVVFSSFFYRYREAYTVKAYSDVCNEYIRAHMIGKKTIINPNLDNFPCKTESIIISSDKDSLGMKKYEIMESISEYMLRCYNSYYRGERELFTGSAGESTKFCSACYKLSFEDNSISISADELISFHSSTRSSSGERYLDIFSFKEFSTAYSKLSEVDKSNFNEPAILTDREYLVVFTYNKTEPLNLNFWQDLIKNTRTAAIYGGIIVVGGAIIYLSAGTATPGVIAVSGTVLAAAKTGIVGGAAVGAIGTGVTYVKRGSFNQVAWLSTIELVEFNPENLEDLQCEQIVGMQEPGITQRID